MIDATKNNKEFYLKYLSLAGFFAENEFERINSY